MNYKTILIFVLAALNMFGQFGPKNLVKLEAYQSIDNVYPGSEFKAAFKITIDNGWHINSNKPYEDFLIPAAISINGSDFEIKKTAYPKAKDLKLSFSDKPLSVWEGEIFIGSLIRAKQNLIPGKYPLVVTLSYQSCNDNSCLPPASVSDTLEINITGRESAAKEINADIFKNINLSYTTQDTGAGTDDNSVSSILSSNGIFLGFIIVFFIGLGLNLTPCVYPLIPITIGYFGGQSEGSTKRLALMGFLFLVGLAVTYSVIGVVTALTGSIFGALLQNTYVIIFIALIFLTLSLSMFGVYEFKLPDTLVNKAGGAKSGLYGAFFMGLTMGIVAAPCVGPFVIGLVTYVAAKGDPLFGFLLFFVLALGLGTPYLLLAIFSGKIKKLPRAGEWMEAVKHVFGLILIGMAIYFLLPLMPKTVSGYILPVYMILAGLYLLIVDKLANRVKGFRIFKIIFSLLIIAVAVYALIPGNKNSIDWQPFSTQIVNAGLKTEKGTIIDFYADWCIPCKELDAATFSDAQVIKESENFRAYKADMTRSLSPEVEELTKKYKILGVPTVLVLNSKGEEVHRITGFVEADKFLEMLKQVD